MGLATPVSFDQSRFVFQGNAEGSLGLNLIWDESG
ncbi:AraC family transcriptional regulator, partial [Mesorhizobium sp. M7A.F.Ca.AU.001.01.1.1]